MAIASKPRVRQDLDVVELDDELVLYDPARDEVHYLNSAAAIVFQLCDGSATVKEVAGDIAEVGLLEGSLTLAQPPPGPPVSDASDAAEPSEGHEHEHDQREQVREQKTENA